MRSVLLDSAGLAVNQIQQNLAPREGDVGEPSLLIFALVGFANRHRPDMRNQAILEADDKYYRPAESPRQ